MGKSNTCNNSNDHESGLKRQIKSLKQHNVVLEQKLAAETREVMHKDTKLKILDFELERFKNPTQTAIRGVFSELIPNFGRKSNDEEKLKMETSATISAESKSDDAQSSTSMHVNPQSSLKDKKDSMRGGKDEDVLKKSGGSGNIWSLFSPRKESSKGLKTSKNLGSSLTDWETTKFSNDRNEKDSLAELSDVLDEIELPINKVQVDDK